ncbi:type I glyceraldehyde-3-phosphate dehydrogenase [Candidatus Gottesmanbacteria bacterium RIFCSPLOWO2_01_FULL_43_11b]|uniref:Type I glyceraldehyde-3-phosphate dehydrogenase n=1 Tax=Candidatus Gottesmanbacteria bacterium RIFCSPLOWO2_01_FULL_43_11b TaxID=1798392 RepID=A0A1F6AJN4_9BACT|nr:MAG: type I glyceraldehyde-3-phosphate dehydrogenase [Candidatus Gottesmanbacteria bacterium RIFCSPLOWO2_01_FULL_43_11b]
MQTRIGINGFGRIGRNAARIILGRPEFALAAINSSANSSSHAYLLKHDSVYGTLNLPVKAIEGAVIVDRQKVFCFAEKDPAAVPWGDAKVDLVLECTGKFKSKDDAKPHLHGGVKAVVISAPVKDETPTFVIGVNEKTYAGQTIISNSSCTTNCVTTILKVLDDNFGVKRGNMTTVHAVTDSQNLLDNSHKKGARLRRSAMVNLIPTTSGSAKDVAKMFPKLKGKLPCRAVRVPTPTVSLIDLVVEIKKKVTPENINQAFLKAANGSLKGVVGYAEEELVSSDFIGSTYSSVFDPYLTEVIEGNLVHVVAWYDNEWGYCNRFIDLAALVSKKFKGTVHK